MVHLLLSPEDEVRRLRLQASIYVPPERPVFSLPACALKGLEAGAAIRAAQDHDFFVLLRGKPHAACLRCHVNAVHTRARTPREWCRACKKLGVTP